MRSNAALFGGYSAGDHGESLLCDNGLLVDEAWGGIKPTSQPPVFGVTEDFWQPHWNTLVLLKEQKVRKATFQLPITGHACWHR